MCLRCDTGVKREARTMTRLWSAEFRSAIGQRLQREYLASLLRADRNTVSYGTAEQVMDGGLILDWTNVHTPMYVAIYIQQLSLASGRKTTKAILAANVAAGFIAMAMYSLLVMAPNFLFMATLSLTVILIISRMIMSGVRWAPLAGVALSSTMILLGSAIGSFNDAGGDKFSDRLGELGAAAIYAVVALYVLEAFFPKRQPR